ncbi:hypothetical protein EPN95_04730 [Patescibacteria group bacterium]|nr:MAG: hypothetical protein EPN95_04730 [Patescibacteria group bacterium]
MTTREVAISSGLTDPKEIRKKMKSLWAYAKKIEAGKVKPKSFTIERNGSDLIWIFRDPVEPEGKAGKSNRPRLMDAV